MNKLLKFFKKKPIMYDAHPEIVCNGELMISKIELILRDPDSHVASVQIIVSDEKLNPNQVLDLDVVSDFVQKNPTGRVDMTTFRAKLETYRVEPIFIGTSPNTKE